MDISYCYNIPAEPLKYSTFWQQMDLHCEATPDREAVVFYKGDSSYYRATFKELQEQTWNNASRLIQNCPWLEPQDRIAIIGSNRPEILMVELAAYRIGNTVIFPPTGLKSGQDLAEALTITDTKILFFEYDYLSEEELKKLLEKNKTIKLHVAVGFGESADSTFPHELQTWEDFFGETDPTDESRKIAEERFQDLSPDDDILAYCTSGTTGTPKPVLFTHFSQVNNQIAGTRRVHYDYNTRLLVDRPMVNAGGSIFITKLMALNGCTVVILKVSSAQNPTDPEQFIKIVKQESITHMVLYGYMLSDFVTREDLYPLYQTLTSVKYVISVGQVVNQAHVSSWKKVVPKIPMLEFYGASEISGALVGDPDCTKGYTGTVLDYYEAKVIDEQGNIVKHGVTGELCFRGPTVCRGYMKKEGLTSCMDEHGWYHSDDSAIMNDKGEIKVLGRISDAIKYGTLLVSPAVFESILAEHPKVVGVQVVGVSDPRLYQDICACVLTSDPSPSEEELRDWCDAKLKVDPKAGMKIVPKYYIFMEEFPRQNTGKISKRKLRMMVEEMIHGTSNN